MIGIFDSGVGGIFILKELYKKFPIKSFVYLADQENFPYGEKDLSFVRSLVKKNVYFLANQGVEHIIIACNTASVTLTEEDAYPIPVTGVIEAALKQAQKDSINKKVGLLATVGTVKSEVFLKQAKKLNFNLQIYQQPCPLLAPFVERGGWSINKKQDIAKSKELAALLKKYLSPLLNKGVDTIIMGCTHYLYLEPAIKKYIGQSRKVVGPLHFLIEDLLKMKKYKEYSSGKYEQRNEKTPKKETRNNKISVFIHGQSKDFEKQLCRIWGSQRSDMPIPIAKVQVKKF